MTLLGPSGWTVLGAGSSVVEPPPPPSPPPPDPPPSPQPSPVPSVAGGRPFATEAVWAPDSIWNRRLPASPLLHPQSSVWIKNLCDQLGLDYSSPYPAWAPQLPGALPGQAWANVWSGTTPVYVVDADQPLVPVANVQTIEGWGWSTVNDLHDQIMQGVPIPAGALVDGSGDKSLTIYQPATDSLWDLWVALHEPGATPDGKPFEWRCYGGGVMRHVSRNKGTYQDRFDEAGKRVENWYWGHTATGQPCAGGLLTPEDLATDEPIKHALHMVVNNAQDLGPQGYFPPGHRHDGQMGADWIPEGACLTFPADVDYAAWWPLDSTASNRVVVRMINKIVQAGRDYGIFVTDKTRSGCALRFRNPVSYATDPYAGLLPDWPHYFMWNVPWHRAQVLDTSMSPE